MKEKKPTYYGLFKGTYQGWWKQGLLIDIWLQFVKGLNQEEGLYALKCRYGQPTTDKESLKRVLHDLNNTLANERRRSRGESFVSKWYIHKCDESGVFIPTKGELEQAKELAEKC